jgi:hypothetical protein
LRQGLRSGAGVFSKSGALAVSFERSILSPRRGDLAKKSASASLGCLQDVDSSPKSPPLCQRTIDGIADCGRSITQPAIAWAVTILVFAAFYGSRALAGAEARCADGGGAFVQALYLSVKNGLVLFAGTRDARVNQAYECLYSDPAGKLHIPPSVTFVETLLQFPISAVLIFLGLLAVKNRFKIN